MIDAELFSVTAVLFSGIIVAGNNNTLRDKLVALSFPGCFQGRYESDPMDWIASIETQNATNTSLVGNVVAGSERAAYRLHGES